MDRFVAFWFIASILFVISFIRDWDRSDSWYVSRCMESVIIYLLYEICVWIVLLVYSYV